jgi:glycosyltransferase involved in cell wall biosynthesis
MSTPIERSRVQLGRRYRQARDLWTGEGLTEIAERVRRAMAEWLAPKGALMPVRRADVIAADLSRPFLPAIPKISYEQPLIVNWVIVPQGAGAGGATTVFRIIRYLEAHGYSNRVYFYNVFRADHRYYESIVREFYGFHGPVANLDGEMEDAHAVVATAWPTAYPVFNSRCSGKRFYFVQDFEPYFYPFGALSVLAENTYRMGFHAITIGECFSEKLRTEFGIPVDSFEYGCDTSRYCRLPAVRRTGVVFYARPEAPRRGVELGLMALEVFAKRHPEIDIHLYGTKMGKQPFRCINHGRVPPVKLNHIYNHCYAGLSLSMTNVTLVAYEMLAAGCIPVVNDTINIRTDLKSPFIRYAPPEPHALASELEAVVMTQDFESLSRLAAASVRSISWNDAGAKVDAIFRRALGSDSFASRGTTGKASSLVVSASR